MHSRTQCQSVAAVALVVLLATSVSAQPPGRSGIIISEIHHESVGDGLPTYIELVNLDPAQARPLVNATITLVGSGGLLTSAFTIAGGGIPLYAPTVSTAGLASPGTGTVVVSDQGGPPIVGAVEQVITVPSLFGAGILDPLQEWAVCLQIPAVAGFPAVQDIVFLNGFSSPPCSPTAPWNGPAVDFTGGAIIRGYRVDSNTALDWIEYPSIGPPPLPTNPNYQGPPVLASPSIVNPEMARVSGFFFGTTTNNFEDPGIPFFTPPVINPAQPVNQVGGFGTAVNAVSATVSISAPGSVAWIAFVDHPYLDKVEQRDPIFDPIIINGRLDMNTQLFGRDALLSPLPVGPGVGPVAPAGMTWDLVLPNANPANDGVLSIDMGPLEQVDIGFADFVPQVAPSGQEKLLRINRVLSDLTTDGTASGVGILSAVQIDVLPSEGDVWCELILYDGNGFSYRAKARNWPSDPLNCTTPQIGLGSNATDSLDIIAFCFDQRAELYVLGSLSTASPTGSGPFFGLDPDPLTFAMLGSPLNTAPAHVVTTVDGLYFYNLSLPGLSGATFDVCAVQWGGPNLTGAGFTQFAPPEAVTIQ
ncbi:MAG: hypothetical protein CMJ83_18205 [Planctomycetes bacterium]|nr:hypothetical protein [Planctomycetota bacterium]